MDFPEKETAETIFELYVNKRNKLKERAERLAYLIISIQKNNEDNALWIIAYAKEVKDYLENNGIEISEHTKGEALSKEIISFTEDSAESVAPKMLDNIVTETLKNMLFPLSAEEITDYIDRNYVPVCDPKVTPENFPYVPAEIKEIVTQLYYLHLEKNFNDDKVDMADVYDALMKENIPIGEAGSIGIDIMKGNEDKFSVIVK